MAKTRVSELAKQYGISSKEAIAKLGELGEYVKTASSTIELPVEVRFKKQFGEELAAAGAATAKKAPAKKAAPAPAEAPAPAPAPVGESRDVRVVTAPRPKYPAAAARNRQSGWVEVEFTVAATGEVQNAHVVESQPGRVFDREAVSAVESAKFEPKLVNGQAVASTIKRRIDFNLSE